MFGRKRRARIEATNLANLQLEVDFIYLEAMNRVLAEHPEYQPQLIEMVGWYR